MSVMVTCVLLKVARMFATPMTMFFACLALTIFLGVRIFAEQFGGGRHGGQPVQRAQRLRPRGAFSFLAGLASAPERQRHRPSLLFLSSARRVFSFLRT
jgi:hypothetical protein